jgi:hypothetical protein
MTEAVDNASKKKRGKAQKVDCNYSSTLSAEHKPRCFTGLKK